MALSNVARVEVWRLIGFASTDIGIAGKVASLPWFLDGVHGGEQHALDALEDIASQDVELARLVTSAPWLEDGITSTENNVLRALRSIALTDIEVAKKAKSFLWLYDTITDGESDALLVLKVMASEDPELARMVASLHWFVDDVDRNENSAIDVLTNIAPLDRELARLVIASPWFDDGITSDEVAGLRSLHFFFHALRSIEAEDPELPALATALPWLERGWDRDLYRYFLSALASAFQKYGADAVGQLIVQPWFADGLSEEEAVLVVILAIITQTDIPHIGSLQAQWRGSAFPQTRWRPLRRSGMIGFGSIRSCKARISIISDSPSVYPIRDAMDSCREPCTTFLVHLCRLRAPANGVIQSALKTSRLPGALSLLAKSWLERSPSWQNPSLSLAPAITGRCDPALPRTTVEEPTPRTAERSIAARAVPDGLPS